MKKLSIIVLLISSIAFAAYAEAATPKKRTRNANRIGPYGGALIGYSDYTDDQTPNEQTLEAILRDRGVPIEGELSSSSENTDLGYQVMFGYRFHRYIAAELGLAQFGGVESSASGNLDFGNGFVPTTVKFTFTAGGPVLSAIGILPVHEKFELFARLGFLFASADNKFSARIGGENAGSGSFKGDSQNPVYGLGFAWNINQVYSIRGEYQKIDALGEENSTGEQDLTVMGLGLIIRF
jgi:OmpA-OmpF porin, OOP family